MTALLTGVLLGAASWALISSWLAPIVGWPLLIVGAFLLTCGWVYVVVTTPETQG